MHGDDSILPVEFPFPRNWNRTGIGKVAYGADPSCRPAWNWGLKRRQTARMMIIRSGERGSDHDNRVSKHHDRRDPDSPSVCRVAVLKVLQPWCVRDMLPDSGASPWGARQSVFRRRVYARVHGRYFLTRRNWHGHSAANDCRQQQRPVHFPFIFSNGRARNRVDRKIVSPEVRHYSVIVPSR